MHVVAISIRERVEHVMSASGKQTSGTGSQREYA